MRAVAQAVAEHVTHGQAFSIDDLRPHLPAWVKPSLLGPAIGVLHKRHIIRRVGYQPSTHPQAHGRVVAVYVLDQP